MREIWWTKSRFIAIFAIIGISVGFFSGLKSSAPSMLATALHYFDDTHLMDIRLISTIGFSDEDVDTYRDVLSQMAAMVKREYLEGHPIQFNLLTDRMMLTEMNNCGAGDSAITLAPDGHFYICPSFYYDRDDRFDVGNLATGLKIPNQQLYKLQYAPICRRCDAFQCHRCVWLNRRTTLEVNTPSHQQCVVSHIERNASRALLQSIREEGEFLPDTEIEEINHLDPFEIVTK